MMMTYFIFDLLNSSSGSNVNIKRTPAAINAEWVVLLSGSGSFLEGLLPGACCFPSAASAHKLTSDVPESVLDDPSSGLNNLPQFRNPLKREVDFWEAALAASL